MCVSTVNDIGRFSESGRGVPIALSRPQGALPYSPIVRQAYAPTPRARLGWAQGMLSVGDVALEPAACALSPDDTLAAAAKAMLDGECGFVPVCIDGRFAGIVPMEAVLASVAGGRKPPSLATVMTTQIPTCAPWSALVDAVRQMIACYLRKIPVVGDAGELVGLLTLSEAAAAAVADPTVAEALDVLSTSPSRFARMWR